MKLKEVINKAVRITIIPSHQWKIVRDEACTPKSLLWEYGFPIILFSSIGRTIGVLFSTLPVLGFSLKLISVLLFNLVSWVAIPYILILSAAYVLKWGLPEMGIENDLIKSLKLVLYTFTPVFIFTFFVYLHPLLRILIPMGIYVFIAYTLYVFWYGVRELFEVPLEKKIGLIVVSIVLAFGAMFLAQHLYGLLIDLIIPGMETYVK
ncbi:MAG TPA: Yip1 family protein [Bacteroidales bacterium]|nr:Yip1 family protein [Bacteroidales bacterium]HPT01872.1 Yip1 family protein [Bacteroidales bacterium]